MYRRYIVVVCSFIMLSTTLFAQRKFELQDVFRIKEYEDIQISPNGKKIAYVLETPDSLDDTRHPSIWVMNTIPGSKPVEVAADAGSPRWSPDGKSMAYTANSRFCLWQFIDKTHTVVTEASGDIAWSPDGKSIAYTKFVADTTPALRYEQLTKPAGAKWAEPDKVSSALHVYSDGAGMIKQGKDHLFVIDLQSKQIRDITDNIAGQPSWSPDGQSLVYSATVDQKPDAIVHQYAIVSMHLANMQLTQLSHQAFNPHDPVISPDGKFIAYMGADADTSDFEEAHLYLVHSDGTDEHMITPSIDHDVYQPKWLGDNKHLMATYDDQGDTKIARFDLNGENIVQAEHIDGDQQYSISNTGTLAYPVGNGSHPADIYIGDHKLTGANDELLKGIQAAKFINLPVTVANGQTVGAFMMRPPNYDLKKHYPLILSIHGGPHGDDGDRWSLESQLFAAAGYIVLNVNYRGSTSYGYAFANQVHGNFPGPAYDDLMSAVNAAIATGSVDTSRLFVTGGSAGGELTAWIIGKTHRFKAAVAHKPVINQISMGLTSDQFIGNTIFQYGKLPWEDPMLYWKHSALSLVNNVTTPTMLIVGEDDYRTPKTESEQFYNALKLRGVPASLVLVPDASHESLNSRPSHFAQNVALTLAWFNKYDHLK